MNEAILELRFLNWVVNPAVWRKEVLSQLDKNVGIYITQNKDRSLLPVYMAIWDYLRLYELLNKGRVFFFNFKTYGT